MKWLALMACLLANLARAEPWQSAWNATLYGHGDSLGLREDSVLNPGNRIAGLSYHDFTGEGRFDFKAERDDVRLTLRPILITHGDPGSGQARDEAYLSQWQMRLSLNDAWSAAAGREVLNWGPAQFRSPSSPFYFDNGRSNPMRELSGVDDVKLSWTPDIANTLTLAYVAGAGHAARGLTDSWLLLAERRGDVWAGGLALERTPGQGLFAGTHARYIQGEALLLYAEASSSTRAAALQSPADAGQPFTILARSPRHGTTLLGAAYTFELGQGLNVEYLHDGHGYDAAQESAYFTRAATSLAAAGLALSNAPPLLGRDYLHLVWQSNLMASDGYWRLMYTHGFSDRGGELAGYGEHALNGRTSLFTLALATRGGARNEFSALISRSLTLGLKVALP